MSNLAIIIPLHEITDVNLELLNNAVASIGENNADVILSLPKGVDKKQLKGIPERVTPIFESEGSTFAELVNEAVKYVAKNNIEWFSILEIDDEYTKNAFENFKKYIEFFPQTSVFMTLEDMYDFDTKKYLGIGNAEAHASSFSNEIGYIDNDCLQNYFDFYLTGSFFNVADWEEVGGLKPHIKVTFWYEWLLRLTNKGKSVFVMPKIGYKHYLNREGSLVKIYRDTLSQNEIEWLFDLAKRDYFYKDERDLSKYQYVEPEE